MVAPPTLAQIRRLVPTGHHPLVEVIWADHSSMHGWFPLDNTPKDNTAVCTSTGWLVHADDNRVHIVNTINSNGEAGDVLEILRGTIISLQVRSGPKTLNGVKIEMKYGGSVCKSKRRKHR